MNFKHDATTGNYSVFHDNALLGEIVIGEKRVEFYPNLNIGEGESYGPLYLSEIREIANFITDLELHGKTKKIVDELIHDYAHDKMMDFNESFPAIIRWVVNHPNFKIARL